MQRSLSRSLFAFSLMAAAVASSWKAMGQAAAPAPAKPVVTIGSQGALPQHAAFSAADAQRGSGLFLQNCAFCHGKDAGGGESGPDLTRSKFVSSDKDGEAIGALLHTGRPDKGMPRFDFNTADTKALVAFIHTQQDAFLSQTGTRKGVEVADLQTGNAAAGLRYFQGEGGCAKCHSPVGDLKGIATKYSGLALEQQMLMPKNTVAHVTVTMPNGKTLTGPLLYHDEFTLALTDAGGTYHSFPINSVRYKIDNPAEAHVKLLPRYTDDDIHNLMAYIQTLK
jgi:cytochrome c oxidase cbb3-type subunit 3